MDLRALVAGVCAGVVVGMTGSGGGALLTPLLILVLGADAKTAVASDLLASLVMRPVAGLGHLCGGRVAWPVVGWLAAGSLPAALVAGWAAQLLPAGVSASVLQPAVGATLLVSGAVALLTRARRRAAATPRRVGAPLGVRRGATLALGALGGAAVGFTSVGAGTLVLVVLAVLYPELAPAELVGTDVVHAVPLAGAATLGHLAGGGVHLGLSGAVALGGALGAAVGSRLAGVVSARALGGAVALLLVLSGAALLGPIPAALVSAPVVVLGAWRAVRPRHAGGAAPAGGAREAVGASVP